MLLGVVLSPGIPVVLGAKGSTGTPGMTVVEVEVDDEVVAGGPDDGDEFEQPVTPTAVATVRAAMAIGLNTVMIYPPGVAANMIRKTREAATAELPLKSVPGGVCGCSGRRQRRSMMVTLAVPPPSHMVSRP